MTNPRRYPGRIDRLPDDVRKLIAKLLDAGWTKTAITGAVNESLAEMGEEPVSRSAVNRYTKRMLEEGSKIREAHEAAKAWSENIGSIDGGEVDAYIIELIRTLAIDHIHLFADTGSNEDGPAFKEISDLVLAIRRLVQAQSDNDKRVASIKQAERKAAADAATEAGKKAGLAEKTIELVRKNIMGIG